MQSLEKGLFNTFNMKYFLLSIFAFVAFGAQAQKCVADQLKSKLRDEVAGFNSTEKAKGETFSTDQMKYCSATRQYQSGDISVEIQLFDYSESAGIYQSLTAMWGSNMSYESDDEKATSIQVAGFPAYEVIDKASSNCSLLVGIRNSLYLSIRAENTMDVARIRKIAEAIVSTL
jgi:hypothetical protein